ncbi:MAG TPA: hypothetical protein VEX68_24935, partial [Bryobacteraceae bacterium]|nr:hypothetical protein [Bryobacteraceae bacterium]
SQRLALRAGTIFLQQQVAKLLFEAVDEFESGELGQVRREPRLLLCGKVMPVSAHQRKQSAMFGSDRIEFAPASQEVMVDETNDMEAIGHDQGIWKMLPDDGTVYRSQVHADHADLRFAFQLLEISVQR